LKLRTLPFKIIYVRLFLLSTRTLIQSTFHRSHVLSLTFNPIYSPFHLKAGLGDQQPFQRFLQRLVNQAGDRRGIGTQIQQLKFCKSLLLLVEMCSCIYLQIHTLKIRWLCNVLSSVCLFPPVLPTQVSPSFMSACHTVQTGIGHFHFPPHLDAHKAVVLLRQPKSRAISSFLDWPSHHEGMEVLF